MDLDDPVGFEIVSRKGDTDYKILLGYIHKVRRHHKWKEFKYTIKYKITKIFKINKV